MVTFEESVASSSSEQDESLPMRVRKTLSRNGVLGLLLSGFPGSGKSALIEATCSALKKEGKECSAIVGSFDATREAARLQLCCRQVVGVNTPRLEARHVADALATMDLHELAVLFIETGSVASVPVAVDFGQHHRVAVFSVCGGDDKASQCPSLVRGSSCVVLAKMDLVGHVPFNSEAFGSDVRRLNSHADLVELSAMKEDGIEKWMEWIAQQRRPRQQSSAVQDFDWDRSEWYFG